jgi:hypothetical protein
MFEGFVVPMCHAEHPPPRSWRIGATDQAIKPFHRPAEAGTYARSRTLPATVFAIARKLCPSGNRTSPLMALGWDSNPSIAIGPKKSTVDSDLIKCARACRTAAAVQQVARDEGGAVRGGYAMDGPWMSSISSSGSFSSSSAAQKQCCRVSRNTAVRALAQYVMHKIRSLRVNYA